MSNLNENLQNTTENSKQGNFRGGVKEWFRKFIVGLKRSPQNIALLFYAVALLLYTLNLTNFSNTTADINMNPMGFCVFVTVLFSILAVVCMLNTYPKREKPRYLMLCLFIVMMAVIIVCDVSYLIKVDEGIAKRLTGAETMETLQTKYSSWFKIQRIVVVHIIMVAISTVLFALSPVIGKLLKKIDTSVNVEDNGEMAKIEREDE